MTTGAGGRIRGRVHRPRVRPKVGGQQRGVRLPERPLVRGYDWLRGSPAGLVVLALGVGAVHRRGRLRRPRGPDRADRLGTGQHRRAAGARARVTAAAAGGLRRRHACRIRPEHPARHAPAASRSTGASRPFFKWCVAEGVRRPRHPPRSCNQSVRLRCVLRTVRTGRWLPLPTTAGAACCQAGRPCTWPRGTAGPTGGPHRRGPPRRPAARSPGSPERTRQPWCGARRGWCAGR